MGKQRTIHDISLFGGHPALDFVNTVDSRGSPWGPDFLTTYEDLVAWAHRLDMIDGAERDLLLAEAGRSVSTAEKELGRAKELREALYRLFLCETFKSHAIGKDLYLVAALARQARSQQSLESIAGTIRWHRPKARDLDEIACRVAHSAADLLTSKDTRRPVRACEGANCGWLFLDHSRGGRRRWCSDKTCGSPARVRKFRAVESS